VTCTRRPLTVEELQTALAVVLDTTCMDSEDIIYEEVLTSVCAGLVLVDEKRSVRLVRM